MGARLSGGEDDPETIGSRLNMDWLRAEVDGLSMRQGSTVVGSTNPADVQMLYHALSGVASRKLGPSATGAGDELVGGGAAAGVEEEAIAGGGPSRSATDVVQTVTLLVRVDSEEDYVPEIVHPKMYSVGTTMVVLADDVHFVTQKQMNNFAPVELDVQRQQREQHEGAQYEHERAGAGTRGPVLDGGEHDVGGPRASSPAPTSKGLVGSHEEQLAVVREERRQQHEQHRAKWSEKEDGNGRAEPVVALPLSNVGDEADVEQQVDATGRGRGDTARSGRTGRRRQRDDSSLTHRSLRRRGTISGAPILISQEVGPAPRRSSSRVGRDESPQDADAKGSSEESPAPSALRRDNSRFPPTTSAFARESLLRYRTVSNGGDESGSGSSEALPFSAPALFPAEDLRQRLAALPARQEDVFIFGPRDGDSPSPHRSSSVPPTSSLPEPAALELLPIGADPPRKGALRKIPSADDVRLRDNGVDPYLTPDMFLRPDSSRLTWADCDDPPPPSNPRHVAFEQLSDSEEEFEQDKCSKKECLILGEKPGAGGDKKVPGSPTSSVRTRCPESRDASVNSFSEISTPDSRSPPPSPPLGPSPPPSRGDLLPFEPLPPAAGGAFSSVDDHVSGGAESFHSFFSRSQLPMIKDKEGCPVIHGGRMYAPPQPQELRFEDRWMNGLLQNHRSKHRDAVHSQDQVLSAGGTAEYSLFKPRDRLPCWPGLLALTDQSDSPQQLSGGTPEVVPPPFIEEGAKESGPLLRTEEGQVPPLPEPLRDEDVEIAEQLETTLTPGADGAKGRAYRIVEEGSAPEAVFPPPSAAAERVSLDNNLPSSSSAGSRPWKPNPNAKEFVPVQPEVGALSHPTSAAEPYPYPARTPSPSPCPAARYSLPAQRTLPQQLLPDQHYMGAAVPVAAEVAPRLSETSLHRHDELQHFMFPQQQGAPQHLVYCQQVLAATQTQFGGGGPLPACPVEVSGPVSCRTPCSFGVIGRVINTNTTMTAGQDLEDRNNQLGGRGECRRDEPAVDPVVQRRAWREPNSREQTPERWPETHDSLRGYFAANKNIANTRPPAANIANTGTLSPLPFPRYQVGEQETRGRVVPEGLPHLPLLRGRPDSDCEFSGLAENDPVGEIYVVVSKAGPGA